MTGVMREVLGHAITVKSGLDRLINISASRARSQLFLARRHGAHAQIVKPPLVPRRFPAHDQCISEIAAVAADHYRIIQDEHVAGLQNPTGGWTTASLRPRTHGEIAINDHGLTGRLNTGRVDAPVNGELRPARPDLFPRPGLP